MKTVCGVFATRDFIELVSAEAMERAMKNDAETGRPLPAKHEQGHTDRHAGLNRREEEPTALIGPSDRPEWAAFHQARQSLCQFWHDAAAAEAVPGLEPSVKSEGVKRITRCHDYILMVVQHVSLRCV
jgi:hypothetical protein